MKFLTKMSDFQHKITYQNNIRGRDEKTEVRKILGLNEFTVNLKTYVCRECSNEFYIKSNEADPVSCPYCRDFHLIPCENKTILIKIDF